MKQKKTMRLWQMIVILLLSVVMLVTMFVPAFKIDGEAIVGAAEKVVEDELTEEQKNSEEYSAALQMSKEEMDKSIEELENNYGITISKISAFNIMTHSLSKLLAGDSATSEDEQEIASSEIGTALQGKYNFLRIMLWVVYALDLIVLIVTLLGFLLKISKFIPLIISTLYGLLAAILFGYLRFFLLKSIGKKLGTFIVSIPFFFGVDSSLMLENLPSIMTAFYSVAFLIAFIVALLMLFASVLFMFIGNSVEAQEEEDWEDEEEYSVSGGYVPPAPMDKGLSQMHTMQGENHFFGGGADNIPTEPVQVEKRNPVRAAKQPMGQVRCTKGDARGAGYALPQDRKVIVGKSPQNANLVINNQNVSNIHCSIRYNAATNTYLVKDHSMNGTFVNGIRLQKDVAMEFPAGTVLSLADGSNEITLG